jgi:hypothetical protein
MSCVRIKLGDTEQKAILIPCRVDFESEDAKA